MSGEPVLVAYATKYGSTREVAADVARVLQQQRLETEIRPAREVKELERYSAVVLGGALYMGRLHKDARRLLKRRRRELAALPLAVFALGPGSTKPEEIESARAQLDKALVDLPEIKPVSVAVFGGAVDPSKLRFPFNKMSAFDARDWEAIQAWAEAVAHEFATTR